MGLRVDPYKRMLAALLPPGRAWVIESGKVLEKLLAGIVVEFARIDRRGRDLLEEADPRTTVELLPEWEASFGLPDSCAGLFAGVEERRQQLLQKITTGGGQSIPFFIQVARNFGYEVTITEYRRFRAGRSHAGDRCYGNAWIFYWQMNAQDYELTRFRAGQARAGDRLATWGNDILECIFRRLKPSHTEVLFSYGGDQ